MTTTLIMLLTGTLSSVSFSVLFYIRPRRLPAVVLGCFLTCGVYLLLDGWLGGHFIPNMIAAIVCSLFSDICARRTKAPVSVYLTPGIIPLVPGGLLYRTMSSFVRGDLEAAGTFGLTTVVVAMGISCGIVLSSVVIMLLFPKKKRKQKHQSKNF